MDKIFFNEITGEIEHIPAERVKPGIGVQRVNIWDGDRFVRQVTHYGTERMARAYGLLQILHPTDPGYEVAYRAYLEEAAKVRKASPRRR